ncbi:MAG: HEAT repeat domain-containing protein, partial [Planctomycetes bacterium]|nr:HEAT repeat domain-containing protein [Planctomycetota bacterium]
AALDSLGPWPKNQADLTEAHQALMDLGRQQLRTGGANVMPSVLKLFEFGYADAGDCYGWLARNLTEELLPQVFDAMKSTEAFDRCFDKFERMELGQKCLPGLIAFLNRTYEQGLQNRRDHPDLNPYSGDAWGPWMRGLACLGRIDSQESLIYLMRTAQAGEFVHSSAIVVQMSERGGMGELREELRALLAMTPKHVDENGDQWARGRVLQRLVFLGDELVWLNPEPWAAHPMRNVSGYRINRPMPGESLDSPLIWLAGLGSPQQPGRAEDSPRDGYTAQSLARIWTYLFEHPDAFPKASPYEFLDSALSRRDLGDSRLEGIVLPASRAWERRIDRGELPASELEWSGIHELQGTLLHYARSAEGPANADSPLLRLPLMCLRGEAPDLSYGTLNSLQAGDGDFWAAEVRRWISRSGSSGGQALGALADLGVELTEKEIHSVVSSKEAYTRRVFVQNISSLAPKAPAEWIAPLLEDPVHEIRRNACRALGQRLDADAVPALLEVLGDQDEEVRTAAREALQQIRFYHDEKARWERFFLGQELSTVGAAQRLLQQALPDQPVEQRVLAIRSLGMLAAPEALPFLIDWVGQGPDAVKAAGEEAIERILASGQS